MVYHCRNCFISFVRVLSFPEECILELGLRLADATWGLLQKGIPILIQPEHILITPEGRIVLLSLGRESHMPLPYLPPENSTFHATGLEKQPMEYWNGHAGIIVV